MGLKETKPAFKKERGFKPLKTAKGFLALAMGTLLIGSASKLLNK